MPAVSKIFFLLFAALVLALPAAAAEEESKPAEITAQEKEKMQQAAAAHKKSVEDAHRKIEAMTKSLSDGERRHFQLAYFSYNMIQTVDMVRADVRNAVDSCGKNNPDKKEKLDKRLQAWNKNIDPVMKEADGHLNNMIIAQDYAKEKEFKSLFSALDTAREKSMSQIERIPVSTPEACDYLYEKLDETEERLTALLRNTLVSPPAPETATGTTAEETPRQDNAAADKKTETPEAAKE